MRLLVGAAGAYALCVGWADAFRPAVGTHKRSGLGCALSMQAGDRTAKKWVAPVGYVPSSARPEQALPILSTPAPARSEDGYNPLAAKLARKWQPPEGYVPRRYKPEQRHFSGAAATSLAYAAGSEISSQPCPSSSSYEPSTSAPAKKWRAPVGYNPRGPSGFRSAAMVDIEEELGDAASVQHALLKQPTPESVKERLHLLKVLTNVLCSMPQQSQQGEVAIADWARQQSQRGRMVLEDWAQSD
jgi:hypothetical protein